MFDLPPATAHLDLRDWNEELHRWEELARRAHQLQRDVSGRAPEDAVTQVRAALRAGDTPAVIRMIARRSHAKALVWLWDETAGDCRDTISTPLLHALKAAHPTPSPLLLNGLEAVYLARFDHLDDLDDGQVRETLASLLRAPVPSAGRTAEMRFALTADDAPRRVADEIHASGESWADAFRRWGLTGHAGGRFMELVHQFLLLQHLREIPVGADDPSLQSLRDKRVYEAPHTRGLQVGHAALSILIDRADRFPGDLWRDIVLEIAGDPRITHLPPYEQWWPFLGAARARRVMGWLARADLSTFLHALEHFAEQDDDDAMERMLPPRRRFLDGLINLGVVSRSRLYLGADVRRFMAQNTPRTRRWYWAELTPGSMRDRALLYVDCGAFHLIEGSHNTKLWIYLTLPPDTILDPSRKAFTYRELTIELAHAYDKAGPFTPDGARRGRDDVVHHAAWQWNALYFLARHGIRVDAEAVLTPNDYRRMRQKYGIPLVSRVATHTETNTEASRETA